MLEVLHELVDAVAVLKGITANRQAELHTMVDDAATQIARLAEGSETQDEPERGPFEPVVKSAVDVPPGA
jgi:hypothetical protein